ncbi:MAG: hypothetical protein N2440_06015 [Actinobacteria bacterium]|nr:hypothetical protein [Actinomycetota bacterium]
MRLKRDWIEYLVIAVVVVSIAGFFVLQNRTSSAPTIRTVKLDGFIIKVPPGFHAVTKAQKKEYGIADRIFVLAKGDMGHLIMIDVEKGLPKETRISDLSEYYQLTLDELRKNVDGIKFLRRKKIVEKNGYEIVYSGKIKQSSFYAAYISRIAPGKKLNITISVPEEEKKILDEYIVIIANSIRYSGE